MIQFYSDHGDHIAFVGHLTVSGKREKSNPFYYVMVPQHLNLKYGTNIIDNQQAVCSHRDIYSLEYKLIGRPEKVLNGRSVMHDRLGPDQDCKTNWVYDNCQC